MTIRVMVYFNLHRKCLSVKALDGERKGRVVAHAKMVVLHNATFKVSEAGRQRVIREKRKNVHAGVVGELFMIDGHMGVLDLVEKLYSPVKYNPYKFDSFVHTVNETPVHNAKRVVIASVNGKGTIYASEKPSA